MDMQFIPDTYLALAVGDDGHDLPSEWQAFMNSLVPSQADRNDTGSPAFPGMGGDLVFEADLQSLPTFPSSGPSITSFGAHRLAFAQTITLREPLGTQALTGEPTQQKKKSDWDHAPGLNPGSGTPVVAVEPQMPREEPERSVEQLRDALDLSYVDVSCGIYKAPDAAELQLLAETADLSTPPPWTAFMALPMLNWQHCYHQPEEHSPGRERLTQFMAQSDPAADPSSPGYPTSPSPSSSIEQKKPYRYIDEPWASHPVNAGYFVILDHDELEEGPEDDEDDAGYLSL